VVAFAVSDNLNLTIGTQKGSRKHHNLLENPHVSIVVGFGFEEPNIQYDGEAAVVEDKALEEFFFFQNPQAARFKGPDFILVRVTPKWMRFTDFSASPHSAEEIF